MLTPRLASVATFAVLLPILAGCPEEEIDIEGNEPGECEDGADNDSDGACDCSNSNGIDGECP